MTEDVLPPQALGRYRDWSDRTKALCDAGNEANCYIGECYGRHEEAALLAPDTPQSGRFRELLAGRRQYWRENSDLSRRAEEWLARSERLRHGAILARDRLGLVRQACWLKHSTLPIFEECIGAAEPLGRLRELLGAIESEIAAMPRANSNAIVLQRRFESSDGMLTRKGRKIFGNIYRIERSGDPRPRYVEIVESWDLTAASGVTLCLPISIGCPNSCGMCDLGTYYGGHLRAAELQALIELNLSPDIALPVAGEERPVIYYLGGGDAALHPELGQVVRSVQAARPLCRQIVSSVGIDRDGRLTRLMEELAGVAGTGFQISVCAFDDEVRSLLVGRNPQTLSARECVKLAERFFDLSGRRGYLSMFLVRDLYDDVESIERRIRTLADPRKVHITLTLLRRNELSLSAQGAATERYEDLRTRLCRAGYEASITTNDEDAENTVSCGVMEADILSNNAIFAKSSAAGRLGKN